MKLLCIKGYPTEQLNDSYQRARRQAAQQTGMLISVFPEECPYSLELILDEDWLPESHSRISHKERRD
ncbi:MAG: DUF29 family protein [Gloeotrichia echinulata DEX184]|nr:DUF29 domain-containing protein [Gloeotrichia echinulata DEX184]